MCVEVWLAQRNQHQVSLGKVLSPSLRGMADCIFLSQILGPSVPAGNIQTLEMLIFSEARGSRAAESSCLASVRWGSWLWPRVKLSGSWVFPLALVKSPIFWLSFSTLLQSSSGCYCSGSFKILSVCPWHCCHSLLILTSGEQLCAGLGRLAEAHPAVLSLPLLHRTRRGENKMEKFVGQGDPLPISVTGKTDATWGRLI